MLRPLIALMFALTLSAPIPIQAELGMQEGPKAQAAFRRQADIDYRHCQQNSANDDEVKGCFQKRYYGPLYIDFCREVVFVYADPPPRDDEIFLCARGASLFASKALASIRGGEERSREKPAGDEG